MTEAALFAGQADAAYRKLIKFEVDRTQEIFDQGAPLTRGLRGKLRVEIRMTWLGGAPSCARSRGRITTR